MGSLPSARVNRPSRAFIECGVDYAGPVRIRSAGGRGHRAHLAYIAVFICMASRGVHLEVVTDYSTQAFLAAFQRFYSRRGLPKVMHSDCGTNFEGADGELRRAYRDAIQSNELRVRVAEQGVEWQFIPPAAPHFGGLWEAGVRSMKRHLKRVLDPHTPTYEELATLLCRVEACLNSRPFSPLTEDIESLDVITPAHLLIGGPLNSAPAPLSVDYSINYHKRWQLYQHLLERFWISWSRDYVTSCQHRSKWASRTPSVKVGQIALLRNDKLPPAKWDLARVVACHPGHDGLIRVVTVRTATSTYKWPISKLALLPIDIEESSAHVSPRPV
ncbi:uncharacterized protein [Mycetomoellerius zeteki]|uniref:uncharacterized protein n=1 Tax=Mycetomoellerius zeteki TaxID=64791 RepID=UPI00084EA729|nr:PREDICTED: uncharacterized protein LOC108728979 [Trachymyrmex zeteki]